jgi:hypothetical protein
MQKLPLLLFFLVVGAPVFGQTRTAIPMAPIPPDPLELVTGPTQVPGTAEARGALVALMVNAAEHYALHARGGPAHILQMSFNATASTLYQGGTGQLRETWISGQNWRWDANLGGYTLLRISSNAAIYDQTPGSLIPVRLKMLANAVFAPIEGAPRQETLRSASVAWKGAQLTCILASAQGNPQVPMNGRQWFETEYCIDPATGLLNIFSIAPGVYVVYDYTNALKFHGLVLPGRVSICENGTTVLDAQLTSIADTDPADMRPFTPTAQMISQGSATALALPARFAVPVPGKVPGNMIQPVIIHAIIDSTGAVRESESLQTSGVSTTALDLVNRMNFGQVKPASGAPPTERESYINVRFIPAE